MQRQLADGLILRTLSEGIASDAEQLPQFYGEVNGEGDPEGVVKALEIWTRDLMNDHPQTTLDDMFVIVDPAHDDRIVSATLLIPQTWRYDGIPIAVGRPELVATHPEYRGRGLVRTLFEVIHERSAALGHQIQTITGISHFYRQFGYTMALDLDASASYPLHFIAKREPDKVPAFTLRAATTEDIPDIICWHDAMARQRLVTDLLSAEEWRHQIGGRSTGSLQAKSVQIIVNGDGEGVGYVEIYDNDFSKKDLFLLAYVVGDRASYVETFRDVMAGIKQWGEERHGECPPLLLFAAGNHESLYTMIAKSFGGVVHPHAYKWYVRVADPIAFLRHIQPVLEQRLEGSGAHRFTGELKIGFHNLKGISLTFERGKLNEIKHVGGKDGYHVSFPWHLFWNVVFGDATIDELGAILPEVHVRERRGETAALMNTLFPKKPSWIQGMD